MTLEDLGFNKAISEHLKDNNLDSLDVARVIAEHKDRYTVKNHLGEYEAELLGNLRYTAADRSDLPAVGDWVAISQYDDAKAIIHAVVPRTSRLARKSVGKASELQLIATNVDFGLIVQSVNRDFNINRLERYLTICHDSKIEPMVVLSKIDLVSAEILNDLLFDLKKRLSGVPLFPISNQTGEGIDELKAALIRGKTYCLLGSSGVGKSTLVNILANQNLMTTGTISEKIDRGRHVTSHRELFVLENGILIDNPGMREVGIADASDGLESTFQTIGALARECRFKDCTHTTEVECAVLEALENDEIDRFSYENYQKMAREKEHFESTVAEKRRKDKDFGKMIRQVKNLKGSNKFRK